MNFISWTLLHPSGLMRHKLLNCRIQMSRVQSCYNKEDIPQDECLFLGFYVDGELTWGNL